jgi:hypothetical protein
MIKAGIPLDRVQQLAGVEAGVSPEEIERILGNNENINNNVGGEGVNCNEKDVDAKYVKFVRMQKSGIPLAAIENSARIQGVDVAELDKALGVKKDLEVMQDVSCNQQ